MNKLEEYREDYLHGELDEQSVDSNPMVQFDKWIKEVMKEDPEDAITMALSTVDSLGQPSCRIVLLRYTDDDSFGFYTNFTSRKAVEIDSNRQAALLFFWRGFQRQVRIEGEIVKMPNEQADAYFAGRPRESKIGAWSSPQSAAIPSRSSLEENVRMYTERFEGQDVPRPSFWGGYLIRAQRIEFWQGRESRLHDRILYTRVGEEWKIERLAP